MYSHLRNRCALEPLEPRQLLSGPPGGEGGSPVEPLPEDPAGWLLVDSERFQGGAFAEAQRSDGRRFSRFDNSEAQAGAAEAIYTGGTATGTTARATWELGSGFVAGDSFLAQGVASGYALGTSGSGSFYGGVGYARSTVAHTISISLSHPARFDLSYYLTHDIIDPGSFTQTSVDVDVGDTSHRYYIYGAAQPPTYTYQGSGLLPAGEHFLFVRVETDTLGGEAQSSFDYTLALTPVIEVSGIDFLYGHEVDHDGDGLTDVAAGYIAGLDIREEVQIEFLGSDQFVSSVYFVMSNASGGAETQQSLDTKGSDGWTFRPDLSSVSEDQALSILITTSGPVTQILHVVDISVRDPGIFAGRDWRFVESENAYEFDMTSEETDVKYEFESEFFEDLFGSNGTQSLNMEISARHTETALVPMDDSIKPAIASGRYELVARLRGNIVAAREFDYEPTFAGDWDGTVGAGKNSMKLSGSSTLTFAEELIGEYERTVAVDFKREIIGTPFGRPLFFPIPSFPAVGVAAQFGVKGQLSFGTERSLVEAVDEYGSIYSFPSWTWRAGLEGSLYGDGVLTTAAGALGNSLNSGKVGLRVEGGFSLSKTGEQLAGFTEQVWSIAESGRVKVSLIGALFGFKVSTTLYESKFSVPLLDSGTGIDPVWSTTLVDGDSPTLVMLEALTLDSTPQVVLQGYGAGTWGPGRVLTADDRPKFSLSADRLPSGGVGVVYSGLPYAKNEVLTKTVETLVSDTMLWFAVEGQGFVPLPNGGLGEHDPVVAFGGGTGVLVSRATDTSTETWTSSVQYRTWDGANWSAPVVLGAAGAVAEPRVTELADGSFVISWVDPSGQLNNAVVTETGTMGLAPIDLDGAVFDVLELDGGLAAIRALGSAGTSDVEIWILENGAWSRVQSIVDVPVIADSLDAEQRKSGSIAIALAGEGSDGFVSLAAFVERMTQADAEDFITLDANGWQPLDIVVGEAADGVVVAYGQFPTSEQDSVPPAALVATIDGQRLAVKSHLLDPANLPSPMQPADRFINEFLAASPTARVDGDAVISGLLSLVPDAAYFVADWGAENYWFQSENGDIFSLWHGGAVHELENGEHRWILTNLTDAAGLSGSISFEPGSVSGVITGWRAFSIQGIVDGELVALWWSPEGSAGTFVDGDGSTKQGLGLGLRSNGWVYSRISPGLIEPVTYGTPSVGSLRAVTWSQPNGRTSFDPRDDYEIRNDGFSVVVVSTIGRVFVASFSTEQGDIPGADPVLNTRWVLEPLAVVPSVAALGIATDLDPIAGLYELASF